MEGRKSRYLTLAAGLLMGLAIGLVVRYPTTETQELSQGAEKYTEIMELVDNYFIGEDVDIDEVNDAMAAGVVAGLGDRWSYYVSAEDYQSYQDNINNAYVGVGITISAYQDEDGNLLGYQVTDVTQGGPAEKAGVQAGDILTAVDGTSVTDITLTETKNMVKGEAGTTVTLTFLRGEESIDFTVERQSFTVVPATGKLIGDHTAYIQIDNFDAGCSDTVISLIEDLTEQGATSLLFDVRNNPGGLKLELTKLLDYLLPEGTIFHTINYAGQEEVVTSDADCVSLPMAVLVNGSSYSAAEYFACAIQEYGVGKVIGEQTCGKGYYQVGLQLSDGSCVNLSIGKYFTPSGESLINVGVTPDIELTLDEDLAQELSRGTLEPEDDPQVQAALGTLY
jgi:carboxyl-terminal processing protease